MVSCPPETTLRLFAPRFSSRSFRAPASILEKLETALFKKETTAGKSMMGISTRER